MCKSDAAGMCDVFCVICTSASYSNIWFPFMWWHFSITTGPLSRDASRHRSSVRISLSAVYENTCKQIHQMGINYHMLIYRKLLTLFIFYYLHILYNQHFSDCVSQSFNLATRIKRIFCVIPKILLSSLKQRCKNHQSQCIFGLVDI